MRFFITAQSYCRHWSGWFGVCVPNAKILHRHEIHTFLNMARVGGDAYIRNSQKAFWNSLGDLQSVILLTWLFCQNEFDRSTHRCWSVAAKYRCADRTGQEEEVPLGTCDFARHAVTIEILNGSPSR